MGQTFGHIFTDGTFAVLHFREIGALDPQQAGKLFLGQALPQAQTANRAAWMQVGKDLFQRQGLVLGFQDGDYRVPNFAVFFIGGRASVPAFSMFFILCCLVIIIDSLMWIT